VVILSAWLASGCTSARANLGTTASSCYLALPAATQATGTHAKFLGVQLFSLNGLKKEAPKLYARIAAQPTTRQQVCVFAFSGQFTQATVSHPRGRPSGPVAVVVLARPSNRLLGTIILARIPLRFAHSHIG
jgi:hypothetical protein